MTGQEAPKMVVSPPGPEGRRWVERLARVEYPANAARRALREETSGASQLPIVYREALGSNVVDADGNRYVDLAAGFGSLLLGNNPPEIGRAMSEQAGRVWQALGDLYPSDAKIELLEALAGLMPFEGGRVVLGQSGADAVSAALKTACLTTTKPGVVAFEGSYHGLSYGPLAACGYRASFREPFAAQLNPHVQFCPFAARASEVDRALSALEAALRAGDVGAVLVEPVLGRGGCVPAAPGFLRAAGELARAAGALVIADEIWTGLGRSGAWLASVDEGLGADLICLGKGLGGGLPISACVGSEAAMEGWARAGGDTVHTATFSGAPLACAAALALLGALRGRRLVERSRVVGAALIEKIHTRLGGLPGFVEARGRGLMVGVELSSGGLAFEVGRGLLADGYITAGGGRDYEALTLTPALTIDEGLLDGFVGALEGRLRRAAR